MTPADTSPSPIPTRPKSKTYPVTDTTRMLGDLLMQTERAVATSQAQMYATQGEVTKYRKLLADAEERHEAAQREYRMLRELMLNQWEQMRSDIEKTPPIDDGGAS